MPNTKAVHLKSYKKFVLQRGGEGAFQRILEQLGPEDRALAAKTVLHNEWLDCGLWWKLLMTADRVLGKGDLQLIREIGAFDARESLNGVYRVFLSFLQPAHILVRAPLMWRQYYDTGRMVAVNITDKRAEMRLVEFPGLPVNHEIELIGWMEAALSMTGRAGCKVTHPGRCLAKGDPYCEFIATWQ